MKNNLEIIFQRLYNAINILLLDFTRVKIYTNNVNNPDEVESYFLELLDYNFPQTDDELIPKEEENKIQNNKENKNNNKENTPLQKEFLDQYEVFKEMFYFLTHKEPKNKKVKTATNNEINDENIFPSIKVKEKEKEESLIEEKFQNINNSPQQKKEEKNNKKIKNNSTTPNNNSNKIKENLTLELISEKSTEEINSSFYSKLKHYFNYYWELLNYF